MRKINTGDVFKMARLLKHGDIMRMVKDAYAAGRQEGADAQQIGIDTAMNILCSCTDEKIEKQFYDLLGGICEKKPEEIEVQSLETTVMDIKRIFEENNVLNFWKSASGLSEKILS